MEDDIQNYLSTVMFRGTPCSLLTDSFLTDSLRTDSLLTHGS